MRPASIFAFAVLTLSSCSSVYAADSENGTDKKDPVLLYREAGANPEQEAKIRQFAQEYDKEARVKVERLHKLSKQIKELSLEPEIDEKKILAVQDEINEAQNFLSTERIKLMLKIRSQLSPEQKTKLIELMKEKDAQPSASK
jgi:Spy/CpxP family protein refolding chaperone